MELRPQPDDLHVFATVVRRQGFSKAARDLGLSPAYVTKRVQVLEKTLGARLLHRSTRRIALTEVGERIFQRAQTILTELDELLDLAASTRYEPRGNLHITSTFGFGRNYVTPAVSELSTRYADLNIRLEILDRQVDLVQEGFDLDIHQASVPPTQHIARRLASNQRILCAAPSYLERAGTPRTLADLTSHNCLVIKVREHPFGSWTLRRGNQEDTVHVSGTLSSNSGEVVSQWGIDGQGILLRSAWGMRDLLASGALVRVLPQYSQDSPVWAVFPTRLSSSAKLRVCVEFFAEYFSARLPVLD
ncbi:LysR substrate-binding domain-containing protein [soil metagenome]